MSNRLEWKIEQKDGVTEVQLSGPVDEDAEFAPLVEEIKMAEKIRFNLSSLDRINSCGVREWVNFVRTLPGSSKIELDECSPAVVSQLNMISNFSGGADVRSVLAPYVCDACGYEENVLVTVTGSDLPELDTKQCPQCSEVMEFDDVEDSYFAFLT